MTIDVTVYDNPMTLWSVEVSHFKMPVGPCSS
jgi:hypothetical protein